MTSPQENDHRGSRGDRKHQCERRGGLPQPLGGCTPGRGCGRMVVTARIGCSNCRWRTRCRRPVSVTVPTSVDQRHDGSRILGIDPIVDDHFVPGHRRSVAVGLIAGQGTESTSSGHGPADRVNTPNSPVFTPWAGSAACQMIRDTRCPSPDCSRSTVAVHPGIGRVRAEVRSTPSGGIVTVTPTVDAVSDSVGTTSRTSP